MTARQVSVGFVSLVLGVFGVDAPLTVGGGLLGSVTALFTVALLGVAGVASIVTPRVPARVVWPLVLFAGWGALGAVPVGIRLFLSPWLGPALAGLQLLVGLVALALARSFGPWGAWADRAAFSAGRAAGLGGLALVGGPLLVAGYLWGSAAWTLQVVTGGYLGLDGQGVYLTERTFERDGATVHLVGMIHVGERRSYDELYAAFGDLPDAVVLAEGVTDREGLLGGGGGYTKAAERMDLVQQPDLPTTLVVERPDIDVSELSDETRRTLALAMGVWAADDPVPALLAASQELQGVPPEQLADRVWRDVVELRNGRVLAAIDELRGDYDQLVVPWGALHLPGIEEQLLLAGWTPQDEIRRPHVSYAAMWAAIR